MIGSYRFCTYVQIFLYLHFSADKEIRGEKQDLDEGNRTKVCRNEFGLHPVDVYLRITCAMCYYYTFRDYPLFAFWDKLISRDKNRTIYIPNAENLDNPVYLTFKKSDDGVKWKSCCKAAKECCNKMLNNPPIEVSEKAFCPQTWDGWQCWDGTLAGDSTRRQCPFYMNPNSQPINSCEGYAEKKCEKNGTWFRNIQGNREWTDYTKCLDLQPFFRRIYVHVISYGISIFFLVPALLVFMRYKQLQVRRIMLHKNLFLSFVLNAIFVISFQLIFMKDTLVSENPMLDQNGSLCKIIFMLTKYFRMTNYMWMFCEGFYLHRLIAAAFHEQKSDWPFYLIGWVFPIIPISAYSGIRKTLDDVRCWIVPNEAFEWIMNGPNLLSLIFNMIFLFHIISVLLTKLRATHANEPSQYRKAVRATLVLVPLFGVHFIITIYRPSSTCPGMEAYFIINNLLDGLQGFFVALIFCYLNGEVLSLVKQSIIRRQLRDNSRGIFGSFFQRNSVTTHVTMHTDSPATQNKMSLRTSPKNGTTNTYQVSPLVNLKEDKNASSEEENAEKEDNL